MTYVLTGNPLTCPAPVPGATGERSPAHDRRRLSMDKYTYDKNIWWALCILSLGIGSVSSAERPDPVATWSRRAGIGTLLLMADG